jgi:ferric-dicitrate binding protein FerR (iron transport regulator)
MNDERDKEFLNRIRTELERSSDALDELTVARLRAARRQALDASPHRRRWFLAGGIAAATALSGAIAVLVITPATVPLTTGLEQIELLADADPDLYKELEFYRWLAEHQHAG